MIEYTNQWPTGGSNHPPLDKLKYVKLPRTGDYHERYSMFSAEMKVKIKDEFTVIGDCNEAALKSFRRFRGRETAIQCMYNHCCTLQIDGGHWAWSFDWIEPIPVDHLDKELFEI